MFDGLEPRPRPAGHNRLLRLADRLDAMRCDRFDIDYWVTKSEGGFALDQDDQPKCGTICCAGGYAAMLPEFIAEGMTIAEESFWGSADWTVRYGAWTGFDALTAFFELDEDTAHEIFHFDHYDESSEPVMPGDVADKIRAIIAGLDFCRAFADADAPASLKELSCV